MPFLPWSILSLGSDCSTSTEAKIIYWVCVSLSLPLCINWALLSGTWQLASLHQRVKDVSSPLHKLIIPHFILINPMVMLGASPAPSIELEPESGGIAADEGRAGGLMKPKCGGNVRGLIRIHCLCRKAIFAVYRLCQHRDSPKMGSGNPQASLKGDIRNTLYSLWFYFIQFTTFMCSEGPFCWSHVNPGAFAVKWHLTERVACLQKIWRKHLNDSRRCFIKKTRYFQYSAVKRNTRLIQFSLQFS